MAGGSVSGSGRGGMASKLIAAKIATRRGCGDDHRQGRDRSSHCGAVAHGARPRCFRASRTPAAARKRWIAGVLKPEGTLIIDEGAAEALAQGKSLLPAGIRQVEGDSSAAMRWSCATTDGPRNRARAGRLWRRGRRAHRRQAQGPKSRPFWAIVAATR